MATDTQPEMPALDQFIAGLLELPPGTPSDAALDILAWTLLGEAAGEGREGMAAVAHVIKNRAESGLYPADVQRVALQPKQFSTWNSGQGGNDPKGTYSKDSAEFKEARAIAADVVAGRHQDPTGGAIYYWSPAGMKAMGKIAPSWADDVTGPAGRVKIGGHVFVAEHPVNLTAPQPLDKPQRIAMIQAVNDVLGNRPLPAPAPLDPNNPLGRGGSSTLAPATVVKTTAIDPNTGMPPKAFDGGGKVGLATGGRGAGEVTYQEPRNADLTPITPVLSRDGTVLYNNPDTRDPSIPTTTNVNGVPTPVLNPKFDAVPERSPALASALARLGATVATKANLDLGQPKPTASGSASGKAGASASVGTSLNLNSKPGVVRTANAPEQQPIPANVRPSSLPTVKELAALTPAPKQSVVPQGPQGRGSPVPQYITKTRQVLVEDEKPKASLKAGGGGLAAGAGAALKPITISGGGTAALGAKGAGGAALTYSAPKKAAPVYRTETYQVLNPAYVDPKKSELNLSRGKELLARQEAAKAIAAAEKKRQEEAAARAAAQAAAQYLPNGVANPAYRDYSPNYQSEGGGVMPSGAYSGSFTDSLGGTYYDRHL